MSSRTLLRLACRSTATLSKINPAASAVLLPSRGFSGGRGQQDGRVGVGVAMALGAGAVALALNQTELKAPWRHLKKPPFREELLSEV